MRLRQISLGLTLALSIASQAHADNGQTAYDKGDYVGALAYWQPLADKGDAASQDGLGSLYALGKGVPQDYAQAIAWFAKAAGQGLPKAQFHIGFAYLRGDGVTRDRSIAIGWFRKAAAQGYQPAQSILDQMN
ncbi:tetratricopeptide repeat protein [Rhizobium mayense]|uniref:Tetratricopeptide repeat protein n=1 Tax=Rhizobium mayense TaxID=1312184 RepID=A0ABT7JN17_9HYPH|nr:tetratricopeptide repeat protein [Rhizobium mayense]MDL2397738.1 tetratricopeptide repeat protein [Rhizobium mayense]